MTRLFIGIPLPDSYHQKTASLTKKLDEHFGSAVRWTPPGNTHITLVFLGQVPDDETSRVRELLSTVDFPSFQLQAGGYGCFPNTKDPRVVWAGITEGARACADLAASVAASMVTIGFEPRNQPFTSHITLGRVKKQHHADWEMALSDIDDTWPEFKVDRFTLWESKLNQEGARYTALQEFPLRETQ